VTDPTAHWSPSEVDDDGARASYPPPPALDLDAIEARYAIAACEVGDSDAWRSASDVPDLVARVRELEAQLAATEAEARTALDALHKRCDAAEAEVGRLRAALADAQPVLLLDAIRRGPPSDDIAFPDSERRPVTVSHVEHRTAPPFAIEVDRDHCPTCGALDLDHSPEECARRWAAEHPYAAGAMHGGIAHRSEVSK
jgi:hypothetical protein